MRGGNPSTLHLHHIRKTMKMEDLLLYIVLVAYLFSPKESPIGMVEVLSIIVLVLMTIRIVKNWGNK